MKRALILGASGFIGRHICDCLLTAGYHVVAADIHATNTIKAHQNLSYVQLDVVRANGFTDLIENCNVIIYLVSTLLPQASNERPIYDVESNLIPLVKLLEVLRSMPEKRLIFASSGGTVYGEMTSAFLSETSPTHPLCSYGIIKLTAEKYITMYRKLFGLNAVILRIANPFGFGQDASRPQGAIGVFIHQAKRGLPISIWGDGHLRRDYLWVNDVANAFQLACQYEGEEIVFNISTGSGTSINELLDKISICANSELQVNYQPARSFDVKSNILSNELAKVKLDWQPTITLDEGINRLWNGLAI